MNGLGEWSLRQALAVVEQIRLCQNEVAVDKLLRCIFQTTGAESYIFVTVLYSDTSVERKLYRFLIGCRPELSQVYIERKWFINDPCLDYARTNSAVVCGDDIRWESAGQKEMRHTARQHGFQSHLLVPAHSGASNRFGALYLGSPLAAAQGHAVLLANRILFRAVAMELLDWWCVRLRREIIERLALGEIELQVVRLQSKGYRASDIAVELGLSAKTVHNHTRLVKEKFCVDNIGDAIKVADSYGLLT